MILALFMILATVLGQFSPTPPPNYNDCEVDAFPTRCLAASCRTTTILPPASDCLASCQLSWSKSTAQWAEVSPDQYCCFCTCPTLDCASLSCEDGATAIIDDDTCECACPANVNGTVQVVIGSIIGVLVGLIALVACIASIIYKCQSNDGADDDYAWNAEEKRGGAIGATTSLVLNDDSELNDVTQ
mmetsp:Transcript_5008/g.16170  ORF Transcript_5008/g.16170 Transcript_5008/m.16170 type:complete len:187 (-) Transcript_5008:77-637(-)